MKICYSSLCFEILPWYEELNVSLSIEEGITNKPRDAETEERKRRVKSPFMFHNLKIDGIKLCDQSWILVVDLYTKSEHFLQSYSDSYR